MASKAQVEALLNELTDDGLVELARDDLGPVSFSEATNSLKTIRDILQVSGETGEELPAAVHQQIDQQVSSLQQILTQIRSFDIASANNPMQARNSLIQQVLSTRDFFIQQVRPLLYVDHAKMLAQMQEMRDALEEAREVTAASKQAASDVRDTALATGAEELHSYYEDQANEHKGSAESFQLWSIILGALNAFGIVALFFLWPPRVATSDGNDVLVFARDSLLRLLLIGLGAIALTFCLRNYRVNRHLEAVNRSKANALKTVDVLTRGAIASDAGREVVLHELVRAIFAVGETGYVQGTGDHTVVESSGAAASVLAAMRASS